MSIPSHMVFILVMLLFVFGASIGSFLCALASRLDPKRRETNLKQVFLSRSHCDSCMKQLSNWELIPVFSYLVQGGKCTKCKYKIPASFFIVELLTGIITVLFFLKWFSNPLTPLLIIFFKIGIVA